MTPWKQLFEFTTDKTAAILSRGHAMDIKYECPECKQERAMTWLFPDEEMGYKDECCNKMVLFVPKTGSEEE